MAYAKHLWLSCSLVMAGAGCIKRHGDTATKIIGGQVPGAGHPALTSAVGLMSSSGLIFCTGTLIASDLIVTAAHCVETRTAGSFQIIFGLGNHSASNQKREVTALKTYKAEGSKFFPNFDVAWVRFSGGVPSGFQPIEILRDSASLPVGGSVSLAGYGLTSTDCQDSSCMGSLLATSTTLDSYVNANHARQLLVFKSSQHYGSCNGDSGGPAYIQKDDKWYLIGATNGQWGPLTPDVDFRNNTCEGGEDIYTFLGAYADWLQSSSGATLLTSDGNTAASGDAPIASVIPAADASFNEWCRVGDDQMDLWYTVHRLLDFAAIHAKGAVTPKSVITDCDSAEANLTAALTQTSGDLVLFGIDLHGSDHRLADLRPLAAAKGLTSLTLDAHRINDASALAGLALSSLELSINKASDNSALLRSIAGNSLRSLRLNFNHLTDLSGLSEQSRVPALTTLSLDHNSLTDLSPLTAIGSLTSLSAASNPLASTSCPLKAGAANCTFDAGVVPTPLSHLPVIPDLAIKLPGLRETLVSQ